MSVNKFAKGEIVMPGTAVFPMGALEVDGYNDTGCLLAHPQGGGPQFIIPATKAARLRSVSPGERQTLFFRKARFRIDGFDGEFEGWTDGTAWNGWAKPRFEVATALRVAQAMNGAFDEQRDCVVTQSQEGEEELWPAEQIVALGGTTLKVYPIGAEAWIWEEA